jgi:hypothetical protein
MLYTTLEKQLSHYDKPKWRIPMPQINQSGKIGKSSSPVIQRVIDNNKNVQQPVPVPGIVNKDFGKKPVKV